MKIATITKEKKKRGIDSFLNQFGSIGKAVTNAAPVFAKAATELVRRTPVKQSFTERLNLMILAGASFDVSRDGFQVVGEGFLTSAEKEFLSANKLFVLCTLQQALLMKYLSKEDVSSFIFEVRERAAIIADGADSADGAPPFEIVQIAVSEWFADLLEAMSDPITNL